MVMINAGNQVADTSSGNYPFRQAGQKSKAWLSYKHPAVADTFAVSTSWLNPQGTADSWLLTPPIANIGSGSVLTWEAMAPDLDNADGYEVIVSTNTSGSPSTSDFTAANRIFSTGAENGSWTAHGISLAAYAGQSIRIAFHHNASNKYQLWVDDIVVKNVASSYDVALLSNDTYKYTTINTNHPITVSFRNDGVTPVTGIVLNYQVGSGQVVSETKNFTLPLNYLETSAYTFSLLYSSPVAAYQPVKIWVSAINGQADQQHANDTVATGLTVSNALPLKKVLVEEFTNTKCGDCPESYITLRNLSLADTNVIATSIHRGDSLSNPTGTTLTTNFGGSSSSAMIDRYYYPGTNKISNTRSQWASLAAQRRTMVVPASVSVNGVSYNATTRQIAATVSASFLGDVKGDYRLNLYVKENNVYGPIMDISDNGWNQYSSLFNIQASPYYQVGYPLAGTTYILGPNQYSHQYVVTEFLDGASGAGGIIPVNGSTTGQTYSKSYTYTLPVALNGQYRYNPDNIYLVGVLTENTSMAVLNAWQVKLTPAPELPVGIAQADAGNQDVALFPNPSAGRFQLNYTLQTTQMVTVEVYNAFGAMVLSRQEMLNAGPVVQAIDCRHLAEGAYHLVLRLNDQVITKKIILTQ